MVGDTLRNFSKIGACVNPRVMLNEKFPRWCSNSNSEIGEDSPSVSFDPPPA
jgi:hypothetical protein